MPSELDPITTEVNAAALRLIAEADRGLAEAAEFARSAVATDSPGVPAGDAGVSDDIRSLKEVREATLGLLAELQDG